MTAAMRHFLGVCERGAMAYVPKWQSLAAALQRIVGGGMAEQQAKTELCAALADEEIDIRGVVDQGDPHIGGMILWDGEVKPPLHLRETDLNWQESMPRHPWWTRPMRHYPSWDAKPRSLSFMELSTADIDRIWPRRATSPDRKGGRPPAVLERVKAAMRQDIDTGHWSLERLKSVAVKQLVHQYTATDETVVKARKAVLAEAADKPISRL